MVSTPGSSANEEEHLSISLKGTLRRSTLVRSLYLNWTLEELCPTSGQYEDRDEYFTLKLKSEIFVSGK